MFDAGWAFRNYAGVFVRNTEEAGWSSSACEFFRQATVHIYGPGEHSPYNDLLRAAWSENRIPGIKRFAAFVHTGPVTKPASCKMGTASLSWVKPAGEWNHPSHLASNLQKE